MCNARRWTTKKRRFSSGEMFKDFEDPDDGFVGTSDCVVFGILQLFRVSEKKKKKIII